MTGKKPFAVLPGPEIFTPHSAEMSMLVFGDDNPILWYPATDAPPGSDEKIEIMRNRAANRQPVFHPHDRTTFEGLKATIFPMEG